MIRPLAVAFLILGSVGAGPAAAQLGQSAGYSFLQAVRNAKNDEVLAALNKPGSHIIDTKDVTTGEGALHIVVKRGDAVYTSFLLGKGADPNLRDGRNNTPLMLAVESGHGELVPILLAGHANPNLANSSGETPLIRAVQRRDLALVRTLVAGKADPDQRDTIAGLSARDYAIRDGRSPSIVKFFAETPRVARAPVAGPKL